MRKTSTSLDCLEFEELFWKALNLGIELEYSHPIITWEISSPAE